MVDVIFDGAVRNLQLGENTDLAAILAAQAAVSASDAADSAAEAATSAAESTLLSPVLISSLPTDRRVRLAADDADGPAAVVLGRRIKDGALPVSWLPKNLAAGARPAIRGYHAGATAVVDAQSWATTLGFTPGSSFGEVQADTMMTGLLVQEANQNAITNSTMVGLTAGTIVSGGVASTVGQLPVNWSTVTSVLTNMTATLSEVAGDPEAVDIRVQITSGTGFLWVHFDNRANNTATTNQSWAVAADVAIVGGSFTNVSDIGLGFAEWNGSTYLRNQRKLLKTFLTSTLQRFSNVASTGTTLTNQITPVLTIGANGSGAVDVTIRVRRPWMRQGTKVLGYVASPGVKTTRAADAVGIPLAGLIALGPELVRNGSPSANTDFWAPKAGDSVSASGGYLTVTEGSTDNSYASQTIGGLVVGRTYRIAVTGKKGTSAGNAAAVIGTTDGGSDIANWSFTTTSDVTQTVDWTATTSRLFMRLGFGTNAAGQTTRFTGISVREVSPSHGADIIVLPGADDGTALEYAKSTTDGFRVYRSGFEIYGVARIAGSDGTPQRLTIAPPILPVSIMVGVDPVGNMTARADGGPVKTFTGGNAFDTLWIGSRYDGSSYWNSLIGDLDVFPQAGLAAMTLPRVVDTFDRADGAIGTADSGQAWVCVPAAAPGSPNSQLPIISSGTCVVTNPAASAFATYFSVNTNADFSRVFAVASFGAGTSEYGSVALILSGAADGADNGHVLLKSLHIVFTDKSITVGYFVSGTLTNLETITYATADTTGAMVLKGYEFDAATGTIKLWASGNYYERTYSAMAGLFADGELSTVTFEHFGTSGATIRVPTFRKVWAN